MLQLWAFVALISMAPGVVLWVFGWNSLAVGDGSLYAVGATIGVVLAGFNSQNRSVFRTERDSSVMRDPGGIGEKYSRGMHAFKSATAAALILLAVSVLSLSLTIGEEKIKLLVWLSAFFQAVIWFARVDFHVDDFTKALVNKKGQN